MATQRNAFRLGLTAILMVGLLVGVLLFLAGSDWGVTAQSITVRFTHSMTLPLLKSGAAVYCGASQVGRVTEVRFAGDTPESEGALAETLYVYVLAKVDAGLGLRKDCRISAEGPLLGGTGTLVIRDRGVSASLVDDSTVIEGRQAATIGTIAEKLSAELDVQSPTSLLSAIKRQLDPNDSMSLLAKVHTSLEDINAITEQLSVEFDPTQRDVILARLHAILENLNLATGLLKDELDTTADAALMSGVHRAMDQINEGLGEAVAILQENREPLNTTLLELESSAQLVRREILERLAAEFEPGKKGTLLASVHRALDQVNESLENLTVVTGTAKELMLLNRHNINGALTNLRAASDYLKGSIKYLSAQPWLLLNPPADKDSRERRTAEAAREFAGAAGKLDDAMAHLRAILELNQGRDARDDPRLLEARAQLEQARSKFGLAETYLWEKVRAN